MKRFCGSLICVVLLLFSPIGPANALDLLSASERTALQSRLERLGYVGTPVDRQDLLEDHARLLLEDCGLPIEPVLEDRPDLLFAVFDREIERRQKPVSASFYIPRGFGRVATAARLSPDGKYLGVIGEGRIVVFETRTAKEIAALQGAHGINYLSFVPNSHLIVGSSYAKLTWYDFAQRLSVRTIDVLSWNLWRVWAIAAKPDPKPWIAAVVNVDEEGHRVAIVDAEQGTARTIELIRHPAAKTGTFAPTLAFSQQGDRLAYATTKLLVVWDLPSGRRLAFRTFDTNDDLDAPKLAFSSDGQRLSVVVGTTRQIFGKFAFSTSGESLHFGSTKGLISLANGRSAFLGVSEPINGNDDASEHVPSGLLSTDEILDSANGLAVARSHSRYFLWALDRPQVLALETRQQRIFDARYDRKRRAIIMADRRGLIEASLDNPEPRRIRAFNELQGLDLNLSTAAASFLDDRLLVVKSSENPGKFYLIDVETWRLVWTREGPPAPNFLYPTVWAKVGPSTFRVFRRGRYSSWIGFRDYDLTTGATIREFSGEMPYKATSDLAFIPINIVHEHYIAATDDNKRVHIIEIGTGTVIKVLDPEVPVSLIHPHEPQADHDSDPKRHLSLDPSFTSDGRYLILRAGDPRGRGTIRYFVYDTNNFALISNMSWREFRSWWSKEFSNVFWSGRAVLRYDSSRANSATLYTDGLTAPLLIAEDPEGDRVAALNRDGALTIWERSSGERLVTAVLDEEAWLTMTPEGFYSGEGDILSRIGLRLPSNEILTANRIGRAMLRPDLVELKLRGDRENEVNRSAARLELPRLTRADAAPILSLAGRKDARSNLEAELTVVDRGYGVGRIEWRRNGTLIALDRAPGVPNDQLTIRRNLDLEPGPNKIEVIAFEASDLIASESVSISANAPPVFDRPAKLFVVAIGVDQYADPRLRLKFAATDARAIAQSFVAGGKGIYEEAEVSVLLDHEVVEHRLASVFADLASQISAQDIFILFVAGHGKTSDGRYAFLPADFHYETEASWTTRGIGQDRFEIWLSRLRASRVLVLFDTCESGSLVGLERAVSDSKEALARLAQSAGRSIITAATDQTPALEGFRGHGVFTWTILQALSQADANADRLIDVDELARYIARRVPEATLEAFGRRQDPQMRLEGVNFPLIRLQQTDVTPADQLRNSKPTHVVLRATPVLATTDHSAPHVADLPIGSVVQVIEVRGNWALVAHRGRDIGYVDVSAMAAIQ
jgi:WD40 repeat protein